MFKKQIFPWKVLHYGIEYPESGEVNKTTSQDY